MRILHLDTGRSLRGGQQQVLFLMRGLEARGHSQILLSPPGSPTTIQARKAGFPVTVIPFYHLGILTGVPRIRRAMQKFEPDILHLHDARAHGFGYLANQTLKRPVVVSRRVAFPLGLSFWSKHKYFAPRQRFIAVSLFIKNLLLESGIREALVDVVYDCVDLKVEPDSNPAERIGRTPDPFVVATVGALEPEKGHALLIEALARLRSSTAPCRCIIAGEGSQRSGLLALIAAHHLEDTVQVIPPPESLTDFLRGIDLFVLPSRVEGLGSILLLAMLCGIPVLASNAGGIPELVVDKATGFLFPKDDVGALSQALQRLGEDAAQRNSVVAEAKTRVKKQHSIEAMTEATLCSYQKAISTS
jgi:glycosyltransferase involved in cell wall biosynthesis